MTPGPKMAQSLGLSVLHRLIWEKLKKYFFLKPHSLEHLSNLVPLKPSERFEAILASCLISYFSDFCKMCITFCYDMPARAVPKRPYNIVRPRHGNRTKLRCKSVVDIVNAKYKQEAKMASNRSPGFRGTKLERCSRLCGFREKIFFKFSHISLCKTDKPKDWAIFGPGVII